MQRLEALRRVNLVLQGEPGSISLEKLDPTTREYVAFLTVDRSFYPFFKVDAEGKSLPPDVQFEAQFGELTITDEDAKQTGTLLHGTTRFRVVRGDQAEPGMLTPTGPHRFYRFHVAPLEEVS
jgi:hypothetical protein